MALIISFRIWI